MTTKAPRVRRTKWRRPVWDRFWEKVDRSGPCWVWTGFRDARGYGKFAAAGSRAAPVSAHRLAWLYANNEMIGRPYVVRHKCDNPPCCNPDHLEIGTQHDNSRDMLERGRQNNNPVRGEAHGCARLTEDDVRAIRARRASGETQKSIAESFGVDPSTVGLIVRRQHWSHVQ